MPVNPLPPQAYTKDTLQKAYSWLLSQAPSVKEMAQDQNMLVSLYLKAQRNGDAVLEAPSIQNFKQELKSLANMMGDFQSPQHMSSAANGFGSSQASHIPAHTQAPPLHTATATATKHVTTTTVSQSLVSTDMNATGFDQKTLEAIHEVREAFNLSSDAEALRALVSLGIKQFRKTGF
ncbi:hypothetical protein CIK05_13830 [Bdellovibrio sp. qaytius]|nr:hypothetical protein CIK05_13830 [Bdellovibrio sp. qaytius]